jgi:hypothetical protein
LNSFAVLGEICISLAIPVSLKGQLISEQIFQKCNDIIARISALASKVGQIKKVKAHYHPNK